MSIQYIGSLAAYAFRLTATPDLIAKLRLVKNDDAASVWVLDNTILTTCCIPRITLSYKAKPGMDWICFRSENSDTVWSLDLAENPRLQERIDLIFGYRRELALLVAMQTAIVTDDFLPSKYRKGCRTDVAGLLYAFDRRIENLEFLRKLEEARRALSERQQSITAEQFENLLTHYGLWKQVQPRVKHFIRQFVTCIYPDGRHSHHHPVGLTQNRHLELENMAKTVTEKGTAGLLIKEGSHHDKNA